MIYIRMKNINNTVFALRYIASAVTDRILIDPPPPLRARSCHGNKLGIRHGAKTPHRRININYKQVFVFTNRTRPDKCIGIHLRQSQTASRRRSDTALSYCTVRII